MYRLEGRNELLSVVYLVAFFIPIFRENRKEKMKYLWIVALIVEVVFYAMLVAGSRADRSCKKAMFRLEKKETVNVTEGTQSFLLLIMGERTFL